MHNFLSIILINYLGNFQFRQQVNKCLSEQVGKDPATVSKRCTYVVQTTLETMM